MKKKGKKLRVANIDEVDKDEVGVEQKQVVIEGKGEGRRKERRRAFNRELKRDEVTSQGRKKKGEL